MKSKDYIFECLKRGDEISADFEILGLVSLKDVLLKHVIFENCVFNDRFVLTEISDVINVEFLNCTFKQFFRLEKVEDANEILFKSCTFHKWIELKNLTSIFLSIESCTNHHSFALKDVMIEELGFSAEHVSFEGTLILDSPEQKEISLTSSPSNYFNRIILENFAKVEIDANVQQLDLEASVFKSLEVYSTKETNLLEAMNIAYNHFEGTIILDKVEVNKLCIQNASCTNGMLTIGHSEIHNFEVDNCQIDHLFLNQVNFVNPPEFLGSNLNSWRLSGVVWSDRNRSLKDSFLSRRIVWFYWLFKKVLNEKKLFTKEEISLLKDHIETYRQLKTASIANNNQIDMLAFYGNEMKLYWKLVRIDGGIPINDRILLFINRVSSNFGQNWFLPLLWMFGFAFLFYSCILNWNYCGNAWSGSEEFGQFWVLFNPVHSTPNYINSGMGHFTEFIMRVVTGYFLYHFIRASRKFGRG